MAKSTGRVLTAEEIAAMPKGAKYRCADCGHWSRTINESFDHTGTAHKPFTATCPDGYTRHFATEDEARTASRDGVVSRYRTTAETIVCGCDCPHTHGETKGCAPATVELDGTPVCTACDQALRARYGATEG